MASHPLRSAACAALLALAVAGCADSDDPTAADDRADRSPVTDDAGSADGTEGNQSETPSTADDADTGRTATDPPEQSGQSEQSEQSEQSDEPGPPWCVPEALTATVRALEPGAGNRYAALVLTNSSDVACRTQGWPGLQLTSDDGDEIPTTTVRDRSATPDRLTILPGGTAWARLHWSAVPGSEDPADGDCGPSPASLGVIPPDEYSATTAAWDLGEVCGAGRIETQPLAAGEGPR
ncbi:DUF4232 domain-containing protein [Streptomyces sp. NBC_01803]|uniref:DUF4232 domain-containing protein n=1 Tax=Streptomyces sp. NBC_01803 TaxID=2975946 RepID=UPI002DD7D922|nr:DUF4232 domain-containing protein [Streptomyces sp. NBC_01803]WSA47267.1 DUF4232 domain-containing protein [Streptomyces sp. NBC_01803]